MTTDRFTVENEVASEWPVFEGINVAAVDVMSIYWNRLGESPGVPTEHQADRELVGILERSPLGRFSRYKLVAASPGPEPLTKFGLNLARRDKCWGAIEKRGLTLPRGLRTEREVERVPGRFVGQIDISIKDLPQALEVTRNTIAICSATMNSRHDAHVLDAAGAAQRSEELLQKAVGWVSTDFALGRSSGEFDDVRGSIDIFAAAGVIDR